jgi:purine-binding chemotaxis protein CheW
MAEQTMTDEAVQRDQRVGKYLTFGLADEEYGLGILAVREIIGIQAITAVPKTPDHVKGVINLRGKVVPVIDLRLKFSMEEIAYTETTAIIITQLDDAEVGIIVDHVSEVMDVSAGELEDLPSLGSSVDTSFLLGLAKTNNTVTILLNINKILGADDLQAVA